MQEIESGGFGAFVETLPDALVVVDHAGVIRTLNRVAAELFGYAVEELVGEEIEILVPEGVRATHRVQRADYARAPSVRPMGIKGVLEGLRRDGSSFAVEISLSPLEIRGETHVSALVRDVTTRIAVQEQLRRQAEELHRSNRELEQFAYVASHDLQEPLRMVASYAQLLARRYESKLGDDADAYLGTIIDGAARMSHLISDLLTYSRVGSDGKPFEECDLGELVGAVLDTLQIRMQESGATVTVDPLPRIVADPGQLSLVFQNLISNALKFHANAAPDVHVGVEETTGGWEFFVSDDGIGIDEKHATKIFEMFERLHARSEFPGTGIGLAICKKVVERHGGAIRLDPTSGRTTFRFTIPKLAPGRAGLK